MLLPICANAMFENIEINGIYYDLLDDNMTAWVTSNPNNYSGNVVIPDTVIYKDVSYKVTSIRGDAFSGCNKLNSITIPKSIEEISMYAFYGCNNLNSVYIANIFDWCNISFGGIYSNPLMYTKHFYVNGDEIKDLIIPEGVTSIGEMAFYGCSINSVKIANSVKSIGTSAFHSSTIKSFKFGNGLTKIESYAFCGCALLSSVSIPDGVTFIGEYAFYDCSKMSSIYLPPSIQSIGYNVFYRCGSLSAVHISDLSSWCKIQFAHEYSNPLSYAHYLYLNHKEIEDLEIPKDVTDIGPFAFYSCYSLKSLYIPDNVISIGDYTFYGCKGIPAIIIPDNVLTIGKSAYTKCIGLESVIIPGNLTTINDYTFSWCSALKTLSIPNSVTSINEGAFAFYEGLNNITFSDNLLEIKDYAFRGCDLKTIILPSSLEHLYKYSFSWCNNLTDVTIGKSIKNIDTNAFEHCISIKNVYCLSEVVPSTSTEAFVDSHVGNAILHVPESSINDYKATEPWSHFKNIVSLEKTDSYKCAKSQNVVINNIENLLIITGVPQGTMICVYDLLGKIIARAISVSDHTEILTTLRSGETGIVKYSDTSVKVLLK